MEEHLTSLKASEDHSKKAAADASRLAEELRQEQDHSAQVEKARRAAEVLAKDLQSRLDEAEAAAMQGGRKIVQKMEQVGTSRPSWCVLPSLTVRMWSENQSYLLQQHMQWRSVGVGGSTEHMYFTLDRACLSFTINFLQE